VSAATAIAIALGLAAAWATLRLAMRARADVRRIAWLTLLALQPLLAWLSWRTLFPPPRPVEAGTLVVLTPGTPAQATAAFDGLRVVALPGAPLPPGAQRVPDLASALREHAPRQLRVLGTGLPARDLDAARPVALRFEAAPLPRGLVALVAPQAVRAGTPFRVQAQVAGLPDARIAVRDPGGKQIAQAKVDAAGRVALQASAPVAGRFAYTLEVRDRAGALLTRAALPLQVTRPPPIRVLLLAGAPAPEWKYLRRWAVDAGVDLRVRLPLGGGAQLADAPRLDAAALRESDLLVLDERAWRGLDGAARARVDAAVRDGLGLLLRPATQPGADDLRAWRSFGLALAPDRVPDTAQLPGFAIAKGAAATEAGEEPIDREEAAALADAARPSRLALRASGPGMQALLRDTDGRALGAWTPRGAGRAGVLWIGDTFRLVLAGRAREHAALWSQVAGALARARSAPPPWRVSDALPRVGERVVLCAEAAPRVQDPDGHPIATLPLTRLGTSCIALWPTQPGWHQATTPAGGTMVFDVLAADALPGVLARERREATRALAGASPQAALRRAEGDPPRAPRWPWALAWLLALAASWALERRLVAGG
jgi:hypothetical protein